MEVQHRLGWEVSTWSDLLLSKGHDVTDLLLCTRTFCEDWTVLHLQMIIRFLEFNISGFKKESSFLFHFCFQFYIDPQLPFCCRQLHFTCPQSSRILVCSSSKVLSEVRSRIKACLKSASVGNVLWDYLEGSSGTIHLHTGVHTCRLFPARQTHIVTRLCRPQ